MIFKQIKKLRNEIIEQGTSLLSLGREIVQEGVKIYNEQKSEREARDPRQVIKESPKKAAARKNLEKNFQVPESNDPAELARQTSLNSHQVQDHIVGENFNSNMTQRNYENHKGN